MFLGQYIAALFVRLCHQNSYISIGPLQRSLTSHDSPEPRVWLTCKHLYSCQPKGLFTNILYIILALNSSENKVVNRETIEIPSNVGSYQPELDS